MDEIEVEPVESVADEAVPEGIDAPEVVLYGGKGGVGKTTLAAATALASARDGTSTLVVSTDPAHSLSDTFETDVPSQPGRIREDVPLYGVEIDPESAIEEGGVLGMDGDPLGGLGGGGMGGPGDSQGAGAAAGPGGVAGSGEPGDEPGQAGGPGGAGPFGGLGGLGGMGGGIGDEMGGGMDDLLGGDDLSEMLGGGAMPGADEAAAVRLLLTYLDDERFDRVVVDTAPTGHTLRLLELPEVLDSMVGKLLTFRQRLQGMIENVKGMFGGEAQMDQGLADLEELGERIEQLRDLLQDPTRTDFRIVMVPEEMSVFESQRLKDQLGEFDVPVGTVVVNKVMEDLADVAVDVDAEWFVSPDLDGCEFCQKRWAVQQRALGEAQELFRGTDVRRVPLFADEVRGEEMLRVVAACVE